MPGEKPNFQFPEGTPRQNYEGIYAVDIPELGEPYRGKVADNWDLLDGRRVIVRTDRKSSFNRQVGSIKGIGAPLNMLSAWWFRQTDHIMANHVLAAPHPNVLVVIKSVKESPIEWIFRSHMFETTSPTSVWAAYSKGERTIYGQKFPDGLKPNHPFPEDLGRNGVVFTPTTKDADDTPITIDKAREIFDREFGDGRFDGVLDNLYKVYGYARKVCDESGLVLFDTKMEVGMDSEGVLMLMDELLSQDASRYGNKDTYQERLDEGKKPDIYDKELLRGWLASQGFNGKTPQVPVIPQEQRDLLRAAYQVPLKLLTGYEYSHERSRQNVREIREAILDYLKAA